MIIELDLTKAYQTADEKYRQLIADYEASEEEIQAEDERIRNEIAASYGSGRYTGD